MSSPTSAPLGTLDVSGTRPIPFTRLIKVELRKMTDTRAGFWLLVVIGAITLLIVGLLMFVGDSDDHTFENFLGATATPQGFLLPVLGVLLVTSEWGQRATLTTFTLVPQRGRILLAKVCAAVLFGLAAIVVAMLASAVATLLSNASDPWGSFGSEDVGKVALLQTLGILQGLAFGMLFLNSAAAIVTYFVLPIAISIVAELWHALHKAQPWIDLNTSQQPLFGADHMTGTEWAHLASGTAIWVVLPFVVGLVRVLRAEVK
jgi:ABC-2 type transport system permease protein